MLSQPYSTLCPYINQMAIQFILQEEEISEVEKSSFKVIASYFADPQKAEENLQKIHEMNDENVFTALSTLLDPCTSIDQATTVRVRMFVRGDCDFFHLLYSSVNFLWFQSKYENLMLLF